MSLSTVVIDMMHLGVIAEALLLDALGKTVSTESVCVALGTCSGFYILEVSELESLFEWDFSTVVGGLARKDVNSIAFAFVAIISAFENFLWWFFFTEALAIKDVSLLSPCVSPRLASNLLTDVFMLN